MITTLAAPVNTYTVIFNNRDGTLIDEQTVNEGDNATVPTDPVKDGYTFTGWNTAQDGSGNDLSDFTNITTDVTVYAQYTLSTGVNERGYADISMYPNPVTDVLHIESEHAISRVEFYGITGALLHTVETGHALSATVSVQNIPQGVIIAKAYTENGVRVYRLVKQ